MQLFFFSSNQSIQIKGAKMQTNVLAEKTVCARISLRQPRCIGTKCKKKKNRAYQRCQKDIARDEFYWECAIQTKGKNSVSLIPVNSLN